MRRLPVWITISFSIAMAACYTLPVSAAFPEGWAAYERGDIETAVREWSAAARSGDALSQYNLGVLYRDGTGVPKSAEKAAELFQKAAAAGVREAIFNLCVFYRNGTGVAKDSATAAKFCSDAAERGLPEAQALLGLMYSTGEGVPGDKELAKSWLRRASRQGNYLAMLLLAQMLADERKYSAKDLEEAYQWLEIAIANLPEGDLRDEAEQLQSTWVGILIDTRATERAIAIGRNWKPTPEPNKGLSNKEAAPDVQPSPPTQEAVVPTPQPKALLELVASGSAFYVTSTGDALTNDHVVESCKQVRARSNDGTASVRIVATDRYNDLALLKIDTIGESPAARIRLDEGARLGDSVVAIGFPLQGILASSVNVTNGNISATAGMHDDPRFFQITAPIQPGNSGGPLLDLSGSVSGVIVAKLDAQRVLEVTGDIPQNVNFAIKASVARRFLKEHGVKFKPGTPQKQLSTAEIAEMGRKFTVLIECYQ
jgi:S1-C subfamily serine protease